MPFCCFIGELALMQSRDHEGLVLSRRLRGDPGLRHMTKLHEKVTSYFMNYSVRLLLDFAGKIMSK